MDKEEKELIDKLSLAVATFNITGVDNPNMIILRKDLRKVLDLCLKQKEVIEKSIKYIENDLKSFLYSIEYKTLLEILTGKGNE